jgi:hypothetical protein
VVCASSADRIENCDSALTLKQGIKDTEVLSDPGTAGSGYQRQRRKLPTRGQRLTYSGWPGNARDRRGGAGVGIDCEGYALDNGVTEVMSVFNLLSDVFPTPAASIAPDGRFA